jgi:hypothetical protein
MIAENTYISVIEIDIVHHSIVELILWKGSEVSNQLRHKYILLLAKCMYLVRCD